MLKILLIGARGQLGNDIIKTKPESVELLFSDKQEIDITDKDKTLSAIKKKMPDVLINAAAYVRVDDAEDNAQEAFRVNSAGVKNLVDACNKTGSAIIHISTDYVFDGKKAPIPYNEQDTPNPLNAYGITKYAGELFVRNYSQQASIVRTASLYGKSGASGKGGNFVFTVLDKLRKGETMRIVNDIYMSPTCTYDLAAGIWGLITKKMPYGLYHIANSGYCSWFEFAKAISSISGLKGEIIAISHKEYSTKAKRPLWSPLISLKGIELSSWENALETFLRLNLKVF